MYLIHWSSKSMRVPQLCHYLQNFVWALRDWRRLHCHCSQFLVPLLTGLQPAELIAQVYKCKCISDWLSGCHQTFFKLLLLQFLFDLCTHDLCANMQKNLEQISKFCCCCSRDKGQIWKLKNFQIWPLSLEQQQRSCLSQQASSGPDVIYPIMNPVFVIGLLCNLYCLCSLCFQNIKASEV